MTEIQLPLHKRVRRLRHQLGLSPVAFSIHVSRIFKRTVSMNALLRIERGAADLSKRQRLNWERFCRKQEASQPYSWVDRLKLNIDHNTKRYSDMSAYLELVHITPKNSSPEWFQKTRDDFFAVHKRDCQDRIIMIDDAYQALKSFGILRVGDLPLRGFTEGKTFGKTLLLKMVMHVLEGCPMTREEALTMGLSKTTYDCVSIVLPKETEAPLPPHVSKHLPKQPSAPLVATATTVAKTSPCKKTPRSRALGKSKSADNTADELLAKQLYAARKKRKHPHSLVAQRLSQTLGHKVTPYMVLRWEAGAVPTCAKTRGAMREFIESVFPPEELAAAGR